jgi:2-methylcitrate dehydratase PrpD
MTLAEALAQRIQRMTYDDLPRAALAWATQAIIDAVGVTLAGSAEDCARLLLRVPGVAESPGPSLIFGTDRRTSCLDAALVNGTASHALDYDDVDGVMGGHPTVPVLPMAIALGEQLDSSGRDVLLAYAVGFETEVRLSRGVNYHHYEKGWHPTATLGTFGAAAAAARLLGLSETHTAIALGLAASFASGLKANFGTMTKPLHVGHSAKNGLLAAFLAREGFTANPGVFEHRQGFLNVFNGPGTFDAARVLERWAEPLEILDPSVGLKQYPCCGSTHPAVNMMLRLVREEGVRPEGVDRIEILAHTRRLPHTDNPDPRTGLQAKFSVQYAVARALVDGPLLMRHFEGDAHLDPRVRALMAVTRAAPHPDMPLDSPEQFGAEVIVHTRDGRRLARRIDQQVGRGPEDPMSREELAAKFVDCAGRVLPRPQAEALLEVLDRFETIPSMRRLTALIERRPEPETATAISRHA